MYIYVSMDVMIENKDEYRIQNSGSYKHTFYMEKHTYRDIGTNMPLTTNNYAFGGWCIFVAV